MYPEWNSGSYGSSIFTFLRKFYTVFRVIIQIYIPTNSVQCSHFSTSLPTFVIFLFSFFGDSPSDRCEVLFVVLMCISLMVNDAEHPFVCLLVISRSYFEKYLFRSSGCLFCFWCWIVRAIYVFWMLTLYWS